MPTSHSFESIRTPRTLPHIFFHFPRLPWVHCLFPLRDLLAAHADDPFSGGNLSFDVGDEPERVHKTREELLSSYRFAGLRDIYEIKQVHGTRLFITTEQPDISETADGLATDTTGAALFIKTADCQSILLTNTAGSHIMALHVGWRGNREEFIAKAVDLFCGHYGLDPSQLLAVRGPSLGPAQAEFRNFSSEWPERFTPFFDPQSTTMDLWALTREQLSKAGLLPRNLYGIDLCTFSNLTCFSYRRSKRCGRLGGLIWIEKH